MTTQANAYYANKLKERELEEVKIPELGLKERQFSEVDKPKVAISNFEAQERARSNRASEYLKSQELAETQRYNKVKEGLDTRKYDIEEATSLTRDEQFEKELLSDYGSIFSKGDYKNAYGMLTASAFATFANPLTGGAMNGRNTVSKSINGNASITNSNRITSGASTITDRDTKDGAMMKILGSRAVTGPDADRNVHKSYTSETISSTDSGAKRHSSRRTK